MKKIFYVLCILAILLGASVTASAVPFQVTGSSLDLDWERGGGIVSYTDFSMDSPIDLAEGESYEFTFGSIYFPLSWGSGTADLNIQFSTPHFDDPVHDDASFNVWSFFFISGGNLEFGDPVSFNYDLNGTPGGVMTLTFADLHGIQLGTCVDITGTITNTVAPVPEPSAVLLMGFGLMGMAVIGRKQLQTKK